MGDDVFFHRLALCSMFVSILTILVLLTTMPHLINKADSHYQLIAKKANKFRTATDSIWVEMMTIRGETGAKPPLYFSRNRRQIFNHGGFCKGCFSLACPMGPPGAPGNPGPDGFPGEPGKQGNTGDDGFDIELAAEPDFPCSVCPAGPPGLRGPQGERGMPGEKGTPGFFGPEGIEGKEGAPGAFGPEGFVGQKGPLGPEGPVGDTLIAGVGIKGPQGPAGPQGPKGPPGPTGKSSNEPGLPGKPGGAGDMGPMGEGGEDGMEGPYGPPGDPGMPASYCPSDCGVSNILAPMFMQNAKSASQYNSAPPPTHEGSPARLEEPHSKPAVPQYQDIDFPQPPTVSDQDLPEKYRTSPTDFEEFEKVQRQKLIKKMLMKQMRLKLRKL